MYISSYYFDKKMQEGFKLGDFFQFKTFWHWKCSLLPVEMGTLDTVEVRFNQN